MLFIINEQLNNLNILGGHDCVMLVAADARHSGQEARYAALGRTTAGRWLAVVFTIRGTLIRVISARDMSRRERRVYEGARQGGE